MMPQYPPGPDCQGSADLSQSAVGLGSVPAWLRPFPVLSNGEKFRAGLARLICEAPDAVVVDEWTSVIDRQIARVGSLAFAKAWRRTPGRAVLLSCHYDVIPWLQPDWIFDTATGKFSGACLHRRPRITLEIRETNWSYWPLFEPHHYLKLPNMIAATCFVGTIEGEPVCHVGIGPRLEIGCMRACRLVVMPDAFPHLPPRPRSRTPAGFPLETMLRRASRREQSTQPGKYKKIRH